jgi:hypothetical protein
MEMDCCGNGKVKGEGEDSRGSGMGWDGWDDEGTHGVIYSRSTYYI